MAWVFVCARAHALACVREFERACVRPWEGQGCVLRFGHGVQVMNAQNYRAVVAEMLAGGDIDVAQLPAGYEAFDAPAQAFPLMQTRRDA